MTYVYLRVTFRSRSSWEQGGISAQQDRKKMNLSRLGKHSILLSFLFAMSFNIQHRFCTQESNPFCNRQLCRRVTHFAIGNYKVF